MGIGADAATSWMQGVAVQHLFAVRRAAGKVLYNVERSRPGADDAAVYRRVMAQTYGVPVTADDAARAPLDVEETLASADYLRAWLLAEQLRAQLVTRFGPTWWQSAEAGTWLRRLLAPGNGLTATALATRMGETGIRTEPFVTRAVAMLAGGAPASPPVVPPPAPAAGTTGASAPDAGTSPEGPPNSAR